MWAQAHPRGSGRGRALLERTRDLMVGLSETARMRATLGSSALHSRMKEAGAVASTVEDMPRRTAPSATPPFERTMPGNLLQLSQDGRRFPVKNVARGSGAHTSRTAQEQADTQLLLKLRDLLAQGGLRDVNGGSRPGKTAALYHLHEIAQMPVLHSELSFDRFGPGRPPASQVVTDELDECAPHGFARMRERKVPRRNHRARHV